MDAAVEGSTASAPAYPDLVTPFQQRVGALLYACVATRPDIAYSVSLLCRAMSRPTPELMAETDRLLCYLSRHASVGLTFNRGDSSLHGFTDASWATRYSTSGWVIKWQGVAISWGSRKQKSVALSSCEAEIMALSEGSKDIVYFRKLLSGIDASFVPGVSDLSTDNKGARDLSFNPEFHQKTKHIARRHFYVRDLVEALELNVPLVGTADNQADFFTKPLKSKTFFPFREKIMNERAALA